MQPADMDGVGETAASLPLASLPWGRTYTPSPSHPHTHTADGDVGSSALAAALPGDVKDMLWGEWLWSPGGLREMQDCMYHLPRHVGGHWRLNIKGDTVVGTIPLWWDLCTPLHALGLHRG